MHSVLLKYLPNPMITFQICDSRLKQTTFVQRVTFCKSKPELWRRYLCMSQCSADLERWSLRRTPPTLNRIKIFDSTATRAAYLRIWWAMAFLNNMVVILHPLALLIYCPWNHLAKRLGDAYCQTVFEMLQVADAISDSARYFFCKMHHAESGCSGIL